MASNKKDLKAYVRYDGTGKVVPSSVILARKKPKVGDWKEIDAYECCLSTTTSTTTAIPACLQFEITIPTSTTLSGVTCDGDPFEQFIGGPATDTYCFRSVSGTGDVTITELGNCP